MNEHESSNKLTFEWHSLLRDILHNIWLVVFAAIIGLIVVYVSGRSIYTPEYTSSATLIVNVKTATYQAYSNLSASSEMATIFSEVFVQPSVKEKAGEFLGTGSFQGKLKAEVLPNTNIITLSVTDRDPQKAYTELNAVLEIYPEISDTIFANAVIDVMRPPQIPRSPSNSVPSTFKPAVVGGLMLMVLFAIVIISLARDTVKDEASYGKKVGSKLIGTVVHERKYKTLKDFIKRKESKLLIDNAFTGFRFAESYQRIATRLEYLNRNGGDRIFLVTSVAEDEGKSTAAVNIALSLAGKGKRVALIDMDFMKPALSGFLDMPVDINQDLGSFFSGKISIEELEIKRYKSSRMYAVLNAERHSDYVNWINSDTVRKFLNSFAKKYDYVIVDTPPVSAAADVTSISRFCDKSILVIRTDYVQTGEINDAIMSLNENGKFAGCILNDVFDEFSFFGQTGLDENGSYGSYSGYSKYASHYASSKDIFNISFSDSSEK